MSAEAMSARCSRCGTPVSGGRLSVCPGCLLDEGVEDPGRIGSLELEEEIGRGGMGRVFRARHVRLDRPVAVKFLAGEVASSPEAQARFAREARALALLNALVALKVANAEALYAVIPAAWPHAAAPEAALALFREPAFEGDVEFVVTGSKPERWIRQTNFENEEAIGYLADRLANLGVEDALVKEGAVPGSIVRIVDHEFEWQPTDPNIVATVAPRGTDARFEISDRKGADERLAERKERRAELLERVAKEDEARGKRRKR